MVTSGQFDCTTWNWPCSYCVKIPRRTHSSTNIFYWIAITIDVSRGIDWRKCWRKSFTFCRTSTQTLTWMTGTGTMSSTNGFRRYILRTTPTGKFKKPNCIFLVSRCCRSERISIHIVLGGIEIGVPHLRPVDGHVATHIRHQKHGPSNRLFAVQMGNQRATIPMHNLRQFLAVLPMFLRRRKHRTAYAHPSRWRSFRR